MDVTPSAETYRRLIGLRAVRHFLPDPVSADDLNAILEAGRWTGSSKNRQDWALVVADSVETRYRVASAGRFTAPVKAAPLAVALVRLPGGNDFDIGRLAQNMMLAADARGVASCPVTLHLEDRAREVLSLPADHSCRYAIAFGYPDADSEESGRAERRRDGWGGRKPLAGLVHRGSFGE